MSAPKHTPGPWRARRSAGHIAITNGLPPRIGTVAIIETEDNAEAEADAALMAAAPELADALRVALGWAYDPDENRQERFERVADDFLSATGMMRPGKSDPVDAHSYEERESAFKAWVDAEARKSVSAMRAALQKAGVLP